MRTKTQKDARIRWLSCSVSYICLRLISSLQACTETNDFAPVSWSLLTQWLSRAKNWFSRQRSMRTQCKNSPDGKATSETNLTESHYFVNSWFKGLWCHWSFEENRLFSDIILFKICFDPEYRFSWHFFFCLFLIPQEIRMFPFVLPFRFQMSLATW